MPSLSQSQKTALTTLSDWYLTSPLQRKPFITLGGYAGTGKTTLISIFRDQLHKDKKHKNLKVAFASYTGKATRVLKDKLEHAKAVHPKDSISTIHSLIYTPILNDKDEIIGWERTKEPKFDLIVIDEASMVDQAIWADLLALKISIIAVGDHGQLPPIRGNFNLMQNPELRLEEIHRQEKDNPIIHLSILARTEGKIPVGKYGRNVEKLDKTDHETNERTSDLLQAYNEDTLILCGYNMTRNKLNTFIRQSKDFLEPAPKSGDRVICLRNNHQKRIFNGMLGTINEIEQSERGWYFAKIKMDGEKDLFKGQIAAEQFGMTEAINFTERRKDFVLGDLFDFGYALTVYKAQGNEANRVILFEERFSKMDEEMWRRWLYTAVTRARKELFIIG